MRQHVYARVAELLGADVRGVSTAEAAQLAIEAVERLGAAIHIPQRLRSLGATADQLPEFADKAFSMERLMKLNPRKPTRDELLGILQAAF